MVQGWHDLASLHWRYDPEVVQRILPPGLTVDTFDGAAMVGLIPFTMHRLGVPHLPAVPYLGTFPEVNVRTYVVRDGRPGVWFCSLDINRLLPTVVARTTYSLPYCWGRASHERVGDRLITTVDRRWPRSDAAASTRIELTIGDRIETPSPLEHFVTARWGLYSSTRRGRLRYAAVDHAPWPLHRATVDQIDDSLVTAAGLPAPTGEPLCVYSPGVQVRVGLPHTLG
jgi:uncharacterized protein YqjF (DUF2071 family)